MANFSKLVKKFHWLRLPTWLELLFLLPLLSALPLHANQLCNAIQREEYIGPHVPYARIDHTLPGAAELTPDQWSQGSESDVPNFGFSTDYFWFKIEISCPELVGQDLYLVLDYPSIDRIKIWKDELQKAPDYILGDAYPYSQRPLNFADFVVPIRVKEKTTVYVQIHTQGSMSFPAKLWKPHDFTSYYSSKVNLLGISTGIVLIMAIYNLSIFFSVKDKSYLYLAFWIFLFGLYQATIFGLTFQYIWPEYPSWANHCVPFLICFATTSACLFGVNFLNTRQTNPIAHKILLILALMLSTLGIASFFLGYSPVIRTASVLVFFTITSLATTGIFGIFQKSRSAFYFTFAWIFLLTGIFVYVAKSAGLAPSNNFTNYSMNFGSALEIILLSFALGDKINTMQTRAKEATENLLNASRANEQLIREKNDALAQLNNQLQEQISEIEENRKIIAEKAEQIEIETLARFMLVSELAHKMNNSLNYLQTAQISMQSTLDQHHDDVLNIFADQDSEDEEVQKFSLHIEDQLLGLQSHLTMMRTGLDRSTQTMKEIRVLSGVDGYHVEAVTFFKILEHRVQMINAKLGYSGASRLICEHEDMKDLRVVSNDIVLGLAFDMILHLWRLDLQADVRICIDPYLMAADTEDGIVLKFLGDHPKVSEEDKALLSQLRHLVRPYCLTLEWKDQYRMIIFRFPKENSINQAVA